MMPQDYKELYEKSYEVRKRFIEIFARLGYGHLTTAFSEAEILISLMEMVMSWNPKERTGDKLVISKGHGAGMIFPILEDMGVLSVEEVDEIVRIGGDFTPIKDMYYPGFEFYGGSLGIGLGMAAGMALGEKMNRSGNLVFCLVGDAECYEGSIWEAMLFAGHHNLNNLIAIVDRNYLGCSDFTENMCKLEPFCEKWESCGWNVRRINGHSYEEILDSLQGIRSRRTCQPTCIIAETVKGMGIDQLSNIPLYHGYVPKGEDIELSLKRLEQKYDYKEYHT